ncbi:MAG: uroporphyrinogen decarboxylase [Calditrichaeota bacterium]|nr:uroporphyrinogen decarboxylase [Calditrichota bacterium]RQW08655.1 MAG: uroporphyrinogen decarboxylase [Calditrichota bacterium]
MLKNSVKNNLFLRACYRQSVVRTPVWMMRQAGRYLPEYRAVRSKYDFITMYKTPELATEVTLQPIDIIGVDAAILFSDILVIPEAMGMELIFEEGRGPSFPEPIRTNEQVNKLKTVHPEDSLHFVMDAIKLCRKELDNRVPLIGFSGAPWTLATYMIEGKGSKNFNEIKKWRYENSEYLHNLLNRITAAVLSYAKAQIRAGIQAFQLFDSWAGILDPPGFREFALNYARQILRELKSENIPLIYFAKGGGIWMDALQECEADVIGLDWTVDIGVARSQLGARYALQGNLDPTALLASPEKIRREVIRILDSYGHGEGHIFNLGHGILPQVPVNHAQAFVEAVKEESLKYH